MSEKPELDLDNAPNAENETNVSITEETSAFALPKKTNNDTSKDGFRWTAVGGNFATGYINFSGKNLEGGNHSGENLENANFSIANLEKVDFSNCNLKGVDFSGANMTDANLSGADLTGAILSGSILKNANFTGAILKGVKLNEADIEGAILLDISIDELGIEELQALIEYLAKYYPHKLNLTRINLTLLDLSRIDLSKVDLRGVDFTGCNFTGVNLVGLDLSQCKITPEQIAQALGRVPNAQELAKLLAPKKAPAKKFNIDLEGLFFGRGKFGVIDTTKHKGITIEQLLKVGKKVFKSGGKKPPISEKEALEQIKQEKEAEAKQHNADLRAVIEARKQEMRAAIEQEKQQHYAQRQVVEEKEQNDANTIDNQQEKQRLLEEKRREVLLQRSLEEKSLDKEKEQQPIEKPNKEMDNKPLIQEQKRAKQHENLSLDREIVASRGRGSRSM